MNDKSLVASAIPRRREYLGIGVLAGLAGGAAEVAWIALYQNLTGQDAEMVARGVTQTLIPGFASSAGAVPLGIVIHMTLAIVLGMTIAVLVNRYLPRIAGTLMEPVAVVAVLAAVWAMNFFVVLPAINPGFVLLVPYGASLISKILFGFAAAFVFWCVHRVRASRKQGL